MVATTVFDDFHSSPSAKCNSRLARSVNVPVAVKPTWPCELLEAVADEGETAMLVNLGWPAPQLDCRARGQGCSFDELCSARNQET